MVKGFQKTDYGVIPIDWGFNTIQELLDNTSIISHLDGNHGELYPKSDEFVKYGIPYIAANDFTSGEVSFDSCKFLSESRASLFKKGIAKDGDVLFAHNATVGPVALLKISFKYVILSTTATYFRCNSEKISNLFLKYVLQSPFFVKQYKAVMMQSTRAQVPITAQRKFSIFLPTLDEQTAIATALNDADTLIQQSEQLLAKKRLIKNGAMQELLMPREGWEQKELHYLLESVQLGGNYKSSATSTAFSLIKMTNIQRGYISINKVDFIQHEPNERDRLFYGDLLFNTRNTLDLVGKVAIWRNELENAYFNSNILRMNFNKDLICSNLFANYILNMPYMLKGLKDIAKGTTSVAAIYTKDLVQIKFPFPNPVEQTRIAQILSDMDNEIQELEKQLDKYKMIKQGMMQNLLTGKIRLI